MKQLTKQWLYELYADKIFVILLLALAVCTSYMYYFVHFSIDGNMNYLMNLENLTENQLLYKDALISNTILARNVFLGFIVLTGFVFSMFFYRFFRANKKQLGCIKALGFKAWSIHRIHLLFTAVISLPGALIGLIMGYFTADILIEAGKESYLVTNVVKKINGATFLSGFFIPCIFFCIIGSSIFFVVQRNETAFLISDFEDGRVYGKSLFLADRIAAAFPEKLRLPVRLSLRKPVIIFLMTASVCSLSIMFILAYSLNLSSRIVYESQLLGRDYLYETRFSKAKSQLPSSGDYLSYLSVPAGMEIKSKYIDQIITGLDDYNNKLFRLVDNDGVIMDGPKPDEIIINNELRDLYGVKEGEEVTILTEYSRLSLKISGISFNGEAGCAYINKNTLETLFGFGENSFNGIFSRENMFQQEEVTTNAERLDILERDTVSNRTSSVINQVVGCIVGCILMYLSLLVNFQDSARDISILSMIGIPGKEIRKLLLDIYRPILNGVFFLTLLPAIGIVKYILRSLSVQIGDYMPFQTNLWVIIGIFFLVNIIYSLVGLSFHKQL